ncbi:class F sortase [Pedobacter sp.]|nr:class F sortase [Candidatus Saccharibacteria bacterium]
MTAIDAKHRRLLRAYPKMFFSQFMTTALLIVSVIGITYSLVPLLSQPETTTVKSQPTTFATTPIKTVGLTASLPTKLEVPDIGLTTDIISTGKNDDGTLAVPDRYNIAAWYQYSPTPGEIGPAIIVGHVDNYLGPAVFFNLKDLQPGQLIHVTRQDGSIVQFKVDTLALFDQDNFPTAEVYGNIDYQGLRLITCGGVFNPLTGYYTQNTVVYASYVST